MTTTDVNQVIFALERAESRLRAEADKLHDQLDYDAQFPAEDADRMLEAIKLLKPVPPRKTTLIQQLGARDCVLASIAMAAGFEKWSDVWTPEDLEKVVESKGIADITPWMKRAGITSYFEVYVHSSDARFVKSMLWKRRALLSVASLNNSGGSHMIFWDGERIWDPHEGHYPEYQAFRHLSTLLITEVCLLDQPEMTP
jgi:hypothetical protein